MFNEDEEWNDEQDAQVLCKTLFKNPQKKNSSSTSVKLKVVGKKSLLRTLETLGAVPEWKSDSHQQSSDSEEDAPTSHSKKKKKRRKRGKHAETLTEQQDSRDLDQSVMDEKPVAKKRKKDNKCGAPKINCTSTGDTAKSTKIEVNETEDTKTLSRQQWKNKMKNKRNCKNKYRQNKPKEEGHKINTDKQGTKEEVKTDSYNISEKIPETARQKKKNERKLHKKEFTKEDTDTQTHMLREEKHPTEKAITTQSGQVEEGVTRSSANGSKQKAEETEVKVTDHQQQVRRLTPQLSKEQCQIRGRLWKILHSQKPEQPSSVELENEPAAPEEEEKRDRSASLRSRMEQRLESARFRYINEVLYSTSSGEARRMFKQDPQAFWIYHRGYTAQVQKWPVNPVDAIISYIHQKSSSLVVADFGCGDCKIARSVKNKVHCFDLAATCELVTVCDMANVPLDDGSVDIAVFCLSLMGTNLADFISEANRVLKMGGVLKISEVASRFENVRNFIAALAKLGFKMVSKDTENTHFYSFGFVKTGNSPENFKKSGLHLKPCLYKKR